MICIVTYSCFITLFTICFNQNIQWTCQLSDRVIYALEMLVFICFTIDIGLNFMRLPNSEEPAERTHSAIAKRYVISIRFVLDVLATLPFFLIKLKKEDKNKTLLLKLLRLARLPRLLRIMDIEKLSQMCDCFFSGKARGRRVLFQNMVKNIFKVFKLILMTIMVMYFLGCVFYWLSDLHQHPYFDFDGDTFIKSSFKNFDKYSNIAKEDQDIDDNVFRLITCCYFSITTLSTVGYGDLAPKSNVEMVFVIMFMLCGVAYFSYIMSSFIEIIQTFNEQGVEE